MQPTIPPALLSRASEWRVLHQWERKQLGMSLRRLGLTYTEIKAIIPVAKGTLSNWSREVSLSFDQVEAIKLRTGPHTQRGIPRDTQWRRRAEIRSIRAGAREFAVSHLEDVRFVAGVVLYWAEGAKTRNSLLLSNTDPAALRAYIAWVRCYLDVDAEFVLSLHLHEGNDELAAREYWATVVGMPGARFTKTFIKPRGTGHRKNHLKHGVCRVSMMKPSDHWNRVMVWIEVVAQHLGPIQERGC